VGGDELLAVEDPDLLEVGRDAQGTGDALVGHRVAIGVEGDVRSPADHDVDELVSREGCVRQRQEQRSFLVPGLLDRAPAILGPGTCGGDLAAPAVRFPIERRQLQVAAQGEEGASQVADGPLHPALLIAPARGDRPRLVAVSVGQLEQPRMEADRIVDALEHGTFQIVVEQPAGDPAEEAEGLDVAGQEARQPGVVEEAHEEHAGKRQHHDEAKQAAMPTLDRAAAEVGPVDLGLLARQGA